MQVRGLMCVNISYSTPIISFLASICRNRSNDNGRPNGMVGALALRPETFSRSFPKLRSAQIDKAKVIKHTHLARVEVDFGYPMALPVLERLLPCSR